MRLGFYGAGVGTCLLRRLFMVVVSAWFLAVGPIGAAWSYTRTQVREQADSVEVALIVPAAVRSGEAVRIRLRVRNRTDRTVDLYLRGLKATLDVVVTRPEGGNVWHRLEREVLPATVHLRPLGPSASFELETVWNQHDADGVQVNDGAYIVRGRLLMERGALEALPRTLSILPR